MALRRNVNYYARRLAKKHGIPIGIAHKILIFGMKNLCRCILSGEDIRIPGFGHIYSEKRDQARNIVKYNKKKHKS